MSNRQATLDANEAVAHVAYRLSEVCGIFPITPSSPMGEFADQWASEGRPNLWGDVPMVAELQSEGGASGAVHGALQAGALSTTFTASQGLLLMVPNMYKIAGELTATVFHVAARSLAAQALSIFGDHADVMATRATGFAMLSSASVQEAHDLALVAHAATLESRVPFVHFFDGFRTSHEVNKITLLGDDDIRALIRDDLVLAHRRRALNPDRPFVRGTAQNPDVYFQAREAANPFHAAVPEIVERAMARVAELSGREYHLYQYYGHPQAERVVVLMGSGAETAIETARRLAADGEPVGVLQVRLYRPFAGERLVAALPSTVRAIAVLDRTTEPGAGGEPLYLDVVAALAEDPLEGPAPRVVGGRYGLSSKEFTPAMVKGVFDELGRERPRNHFTVGIHDDVSGTSIDYDPAFVIEPEDSVGAVFFGLGADGTVGANKNTIKIIGEDPAFQAQGYFVYDSRKSGSQTTSHLRFGPGAIRAPYLVQNAKFIGCHQFGFVTTSDVLERATRGTTFLLNSAYGPDEVWSHLPRAVQQRIIDLEIEFYVIDAYQVARDNGMGTRINTIMQTCFFAISGVLAREQAIDKIKSYIRKTYARKGDEIVQRNFDAVDQALAHLHRVEVPDAANAPDGGERTRIPDQAPEFVRQVTAGLLAGRGDELPVSALPVDGTYPSGTTRWEKRRVSPYAPHWDAQTCIQCGNCAMVCPHAVIRAKFYDRALLDDAPPSFRAATLSGRGFPGIRYTWRTCAGDCTGGGRCVEVCPARSRSESGRRAINMEPVAARFDEVRAEVDFFERIPDNDRARLDFSNVRGVQYLRPLFEFSGACAGCGETPYLKLVSQLFGDRMLVANATGCSSIYGGNLPTTPWSVNDEGRGPAWSNSLFEDNAEFGLGFRLTADQHRKMAEALVERLREPIGPELADALLNAPQGEETQIRAQRARVEALRTRLEPLADADGNNEASHLLSLSDHLVRRSVWIVGGDGWAYDIGYGGLDHVLASGRDLNVLVLDTEVYSNTGGQMSKATPLGAVAKFAAGGKTTAKKDLALQASSYGNVYVARIALGANPQQALLALREAERYRGPSLILAYSHCIAHGINMEHGLRQQKLAVDSGHWPLIRYNPRLRDEGHNPFLLDSQRPRARLADYAYNEMRYRILRRTDARQAENLMRLAQENVNVKWAVYEEMATRGDASFHFAGRA